jgi:SAM-dependent methyltransferase
MTRYPSPIDFAQAWHDCTAQDPNHRGEAAVDLAFWRAHAAGFDEHARASGYYEGTLAALQALVRPSDTLLDVGAGTGRFALPLARSVHQVTALDHARPMLDVLRQRARQHEIINLTLVEAAWENAEVERHDVVLAAWSLYRLPDMLAGMHKLIAATRRTLIIVAGAGHSIRHDPLQRRFWPQVDRNDTPMHIYFYGVLWQAGVHPELYIVHDRHLIQGDTPQAIARHLAPACATDAQIEAYCGHLSPQMQPTETGWCYAHHVPVGLLVWHVEPIPSRSLQRSCCLDSSVPSGRSDLV